MKKILLCIKEINSFEGSLFVYSLSYSLLLTIAPACIVMVASLQWFRINLTNVLNTLALFVPDEFIFPFVEYLLNNGNTSKWTSLVIMSISLFLSSRSIYYFLLIASRLEKIEYPKWSLRIYSFYEFLFIYMYILICLLIDAIFLNGTNGFGSFLYFSASLIGFYIFYHLCTFKARKKRYGLIGACFSTISIYLVGLLLFKIIHTFTNYDNIYGPLASFMILALSVFVISTIIYTGYIINNIYDEDENEVRRKNTFFHLCVIIEKKLLERKSHESRN